MATGNRSLKVRSGPGTVFPVIGAVTEGQQFLIVGKDANGSRWQIDNHGQPGWVFRQSVTTVGETENGQLVLGDQFLMGEPQETTH